ncbi:hemerythrin domain-containing protein [Soonwooa sp.]|uniref:hemerythrin domain-containing protein n=1 Tax=Soonwooa sp. TaxID=1938592 RepID=UPI0028A17CD8|nr:hemerythrin domain-containing protein [Soonwooa sp.]
MKRNENIIPLSHDHHFGLLCCWKIRQGLKKEVELSRIQKYVDYFWNQHLKEHFKEEEEILFPYLKDEFSNRVAKEHQDLEVLFNEISENLSIQNFEAFANLLDDHIRYEERQWFPHLEQNLNKNQLLEIGKALAEIHSDEKDNFNDEFWK